MQTGRENLNLKKNLLDTAKILLFLREKCEKRPNKTNLLRKNIFEDFLSGMSAEEITEKYNIKSSEPSNYINKVLNRFAKYAGISNPIGLRSIRKGASDLLIS